LKVIANGVVLDINIPRDTIMGFIRVFSKRQEDIYFMSIHPHVKSGLTKITPELDSDVERTKYLAILELYNIVVDYYDKNVYIK
jgi:hypothetical protein